MKTFKLELAIAAAALFALGAFVATRPQAAEAVQSAGLTQFTKADYAAFDRDFDLRGNVCKVGLKRDRLCFGQSPVEAILVPGQVLAQDVPLTGAEFRIIVATDLKKDGLRTARFGRSLALVDPETRHIHDVLHLSAPSYDASRDAVAGN